MVKLFMTSLLGSMPILFLLAVTGLIFKIGFTGFLFFVILKFWTDLLFMLIWNPDKVI